MREQIRPKQQSAVIPVHGNAFYRSFRLQLGVIRIKLFDFGQKQEIFLFSEALIKARWPIQRLIQCVPVAFTPG
jgi:hypothetical protein